jgi:hypothetical protein
MEVPKAVKPNLELTPLDRTLGWFE